MSENQICTSMFGFLCFGDVSFPLSMEALDRAVGGDDDGPATLDACRRWCGVRVG